MNEPRVTPPETRRLTLDSAVKYAIIGLCVVLMLDVAIRHLRPLWASETPVVTARARPPVAPEEPLPTEPLSLEWVALQGDPTAPVAIIAYSDFQCPYCRVFAQTIWPDLQRAVIDTGQAQFAFRHLPLDAIHPQARRVGTVAECARQSGKFWEFHDVAFERQRELATVDLGDLAASVGLRKPVVLACADESQAIDVVNRDSREAARLGVRGTPTFFVGRVQADGRVRVTRRLVGAQAVEAFRSAVTEAAASPQ
jgi:protein-disulfide isomerase